MQFHHGQRGLAQRYAQMPLSRVRDAVAGCKPGCHPERAVMDLAPLVLLALVVMT
jgi:hypothetical protein